MTQWASSWRARSPRTSTQTCAAPGNYKKTVLEGLASGKTGQAAGQGLYDWSKKDPDDFRRRKQSPYFDGVREWTMPE